MEALTYVCSRCGFIGLYTPESFADDRRCPGCGARADQYTTDGEVTEAVRTI